LIDIRGADEFSGKIFAAPGFQELAVRAGHIPGAINVPWGQNVNADGTFKTVAELKKLYADKGVDGKQNIITYCRIGERSSLTWFVLSEILGYNVKNYDGSWTEYGNTVGVPINNPAGTIWGNCLINSNQLQSDGLGTSGAVTPLWSIRLREYGHYFQL
jgi:thiosulfate/3-mercaptopyruvate sulfurtransferase